MVSGYTESLKFVVSVSDLKAAFMPKACVCFFNNIRRSVKISPSVFKRMKLISIKQNNFVSEILSLERKSCTDPTCLSQIPVF